MNSVEIKDKQAQLIKRCEEIVNACKVEVREMTEDELLARLTELLELMGYDYDRFSASSREAYTEVMSIIALLTH